MRQTHLLSTALGAALLLGGPAFAQTYGSDPTAPLGQQQQAARTMGTSDSGHRQAQNLIRQSMDALDRGNWARANEYAERAETTILNSQAMEGGTPRSLPALSEASEAMRARDRESARSALRQAMAQLDQSSDMATGTTVPSAPAQGGGGMANQRQTIPLVPGDERLSRPAQDQGGAWQSGAFRDAVPDPASPAARPMTPSQAMPSQPPGPVTSGEAEGGRGQAGLTGPAAEGQPGR